MKEMVGGCCVCSDERGWPDNPLVYCDGNGCTVAVHQACYGIVTVPTGPWYCRKCEVPEIKGKVRCELCPSKSGALKRTDTGGWAHVVCALYIPEVRFGNVTSMEPIVLRLIPPERYSKQCYICQESHKSHRASAGACMQCNKSGCRQQFHVTCAQSLGLLCEEAGNYLDNVKYCGYCQHHYSKLKKGGNVKTIPPYKPVTHDSHSSDSSGEKEGDASPMAGGSGTPTHTSKPKGLGRKSSHTGNSASGKNTPNSKSSNTSQTQDKKKPSPARRGSSASEGGASAAGGGSSKASTPAPSPQHASDAQPPKGGSTPSSKSTPPSASPCSKTQDSVGVISSVTSATPPAPATSVTTTSSSTVVTTSVVQVAVYKETVITNTECTETKQTKKRKAVAAASQNAPVDYAATLPTVATVATTHSTTTMWDGSSDVQMMEGIEKIVKKAKTEGSESQPAGHFASMSPAPLPPPPPPPPVSRPSPRNIASPMPGPSGVNTVSNIRSPPHPQLAAKGGRDRRVSLIVSVPLPSKNQVLNITAYSKIPAQGSAQSAPAETSSSSPHIFHQPQKQSTLEPSMPGHSPHGRTAWSGLNVAYEMQQEPGKPGVSGVGAGKDLTTGGSNVAPMPPAMRNKKRAAMVASVSMSNTASPTIQAPSTQSLASVRRHPQPTPPPVYQETITDSPPNSPSSERPLKPKAENKVGASCSAPHMLGNELNPESGAAARLQEQLTAELAAHAAGAAAHDALVPPPLINKAQPGMGSLRGSSSSAQSLDQLLERQWEQGSQFLMEQAQHFDIASLLSCLHQLRTENVRLEEHVGNLLQRRDHLLAVNARLAIPLTTGVSGGGGGGIPGGAGGEGSRCPREGGAGGPRAPPPPPPRAETASADRAHQLMMREVQQKPS